MAIETEVKPRGIPWYLTEDPGERRKKYHHLRSLGFDSYQACKMKDWPWPMIQDYIKRHARLGNPEVKQYKPRRPKAHTDSGSAERLLPIP